MALDDGLQRAGSNLDPDDWDDFRRQAHTLLDQCVDRLAAAHTHPWQPVTGQACAAWALGAADTGAGYATVAEQLARDVMPYATGNTHPRFFGWVHGTGLAVGLLAELAAVTMNSNCGGRDHGAVYVEREVIDWCRRTFGFPAQSSGVLVTGTSQATVVALAAARQRALGDASRRDGLRGVPALAAYAVQGAHNAIIKALELLGIGSAALRAIPAGSDGGMDVGALVAAIARDRAEGRQPFCVIGTAGSVDMGDFDPLTALADVCARARLWFHIDGAFGAWARLAGAPWDRLCDGMERADSIAFDFHKWMYVPYDCGAVLLRDEEAHRAAFAARPAYLAAQDAGLGGGEPWYCDYGIDLSRGFRALKVWAALRTHGTSELGAAIARNCRLAALMARSVESTPGLVLAAPVRLNVCCFSAAPAEAAPEDRDRLNARIAMQLQIDGEAVFSTTRVGGRLIIRAAIVNHRTEAVDIDYAVAAVARLRSVLLAEGA